MKLFVDILTSDHTYRDARGTSWLHPALPTRVLAAGLFGSSDGWLYHIEAGRFVTADTVADAGLRDMDTLVVVAADLSLADPAVIDRHWARSGGAIRRAAGAGMPPRQRAALMAYAQ